MGPPQTLAAKIATSLNSDDFRHLPIEHDHFGSAFSWELLAPLLWPMPAYWYSRLRRSSEAPSTDVVALEGVVVRMENEHVCICGGLWWFLKP